MLRSFQESEVSDLQWFTYEEALEKIRPYNIERKKLLQCVHCMVKDHFTYVEKEKDMRSKE